MERRDFIQTFAKGSKTAAKKYKVIVQTSAVNAASIEAPSRGLEPYQGPWEKDQVIHLLRRTTFGAKKEDIDLLKGMSAQQAVELLLNAPAEHPAPPLNNYNDAKFEDPYVAFGETWVSAPKTSGTNAKRNKSFKTWWTGIMLNQSTSALEKMVLFWHNHFVVGASEVKDARYLYLNNVLLRSYALGNFKQMTKAITIDPAMLRYLNGYANTLTAPDENYARELQELFTLGKGPDSQYTEDDVKAAARVLTGWKDDKDELTSKFAAAKHDKNDKQFSSYYNNKIIKGRKGVNGALELDDLVNMIFAQEEVSKFICRKLYRWFVYYAIDQSVEANIITPLALIFRNNNYEIKPVLSALFSSAHFYDLLNVGCVIKSPVDYTIGLCREYGIRFPDNSDIDTQYNAWNFIRTQNADLQMEVAEAPNVAGWPAYYQEPLYHELWISSDTFPKRVKLCDTFISPKGKKINKTWLVIDPLSFADTFANPGDPNALVNDLIQQLYSISVSDNQKAAMKNILLSGQLNDYYWTSAWEAYKSNPGNEMNKDIVTVRLRSLLKYLMNNAEYQLS